MENDLPPLMETREADGVTIVRVSCPELRQPAQAIDLGEQLSALVTSGRHPRILIDFEQVHYMGSTGFATLMVLAKKAGKLGVRIAMCNLQPEVRFGADILGFGTLIPIHDDEPTALAAL